MREPMPTVAVLFGGCSSEHDVSLHSASAVLRAVDPARYRVLPVGIRRDDGAWFLCDASPDAIATGAWEDGTLVPVAASPDRRVHGLVALDDGRTFRLDAALPILHGASGENGCVQGVFELAGIPLVGCGVVGSAICADKLLSHRIARAEGIPVARHAVVRRNDYRSIVEARAAELGYPLFVKPPREGSSMGLSRVERADDLDAAVRLALTFDDVAMIEEEIDGSEVGCALLEVGGELLVGEPDEVALNGAVFDYREKYTCDTADIVVPARISPEDRRRAIELAKRLFRLLACTGFARIDLFLSRDGRLFFNEANTIPGFTEHSRFPAMFAAAGMPLRKLLTLAIEEALAR